MINIDETLEIPKHIKSKNSKVSKAKNKAKHKHTYKECFAIHNTTAMGKDIQSICLTTYCTICGKISHEVSKDTIVQENRRIYGLLGNNDKEIYKKYKDKIPTFYIDDYFQKYVNLNEKKEREQ